MIESRIAPRVVPRFAAAAALCAATAALCAAVAALVAAAPAAAQDFPQLAPGLWEMNRVSDAAPAQANANANRMTLCLDRSLSKEMFEMGVGAMKGMCSRHEFHLSGGRGTGDFVCEMGGSRMHSTSTMVLDGDTAYRTEIHTTWDPPFMDRAKSDTVLTAHRVGACPPGERPGDVTTAQGTRFNIRDALEGQRGAGHQGSLTPQGH